MKHICKILYSLFLLCHLNAHPLLFLSSNKLTSREDTITACQTTSSGEITNCECANGISLRNPVAISYLNGSLFIANYGLPSHMGTSYISRCEFNGTHFKECFPVLGLASNYHITGVRALGQKLFFIESYHYNKYNANNIVACDLPVIPKHLNCGPLNGLRPITKILSTEFNTTMDIASDGSSIYVSDKVGQSFFKCTYPDDHNVMNCTPESQSTKASSPALIDIQKNIACNGYAAGAPTDAAFDCCINTAAGNRCSSATQERFSALSSLSIDAQKELVYVVNHNKSADGNVSLCHLNEEKITLGGCQNLQPNDSLQEHFSQVLFTPDAE